jgi:hypothetical protein
MSDSIPGPETVRLRDGVKSLSRELGILTGVSGPLYVLVEQVRESNKLALSNQRSLRFTLGALFFCFLGIFYSLYLVDGAVDEVRSLQVQQAKSFEFAKSTDDKVDAAQRAIDEAPRIVADDMGGLRVVATVEVTEADASAAKVVVATSDKPVSAGSRAKKSSKSAMAMVDEALAEPESVGDKKRVSIPIRVQMAEIE